MIEMKIEVYTVDIELDKAIGESFEKSLIFYLENKNDKRSFFVSFVILDFKKQTMTYVFTYNDENISILEKAPENEIYVRRKSPHCSISVNEGEDFITFNEDEDFFVYVNYKKNIMRVYTMNDFTSKSGGKFLKISHTLYKDDDDPNYFYIGSVDSDNMFHIFKMSLDLNEIEVVDTFKSPKIPPHVLRKYKDFMFLSCEFSYSRFQLLNQKSEVTQDELSKIYFKNSLFLPNKIVEDDGFFTNNKNVPCEINKEMGLLYYNVREKYNIKCVPGRIMLLNLKTLEKTYYNTTGGSPAHFEIDEKNNYIYTSSHNAFGYKEKLVFLEPAVIDKFELIEDKLVLKGSFSTPKGYRFTTHKIMNFNGKSYLCTLAQPNRLMVVDAEKMELEYTYDIERDELSDINDVSLYINCRKTDFEIVSLEVSQDEKYLIMIGPSYVYFFDFAKKEIVYKLDHKSFNFENDKIDLHNDYRIRTIHVDYLK